MTTLHFLPRRFWLVTSLIAGLALSSCATKPERRGPPPDDHRSGQQSRSSGTFLHPVAALFVSLDKEGDKLTSRAELAEGITSEWSSFDRNPSAVYFTPWIEQTFGSSDAMPNFMSFDQDFNGVITAEEFSTGLEREFGRIDRNKDASLSRSEMIIAFTAPQGQRSRGDGQDGRSERGGRSGQGRRPPR